MSNLVEIDVHVRLLLSLVSRRPDRRIGFPPCELDLGVGSLRVVGRAFLALSQPGWIAFGGGFTWLTVARASWDNWGGGDGVAF